MKISKSSYLQLFIVATLVLALVRCVFPGVSGKIEEKSSITSDNISDKKNSQDSVDSKQFETDTTIVAPTSSSVKSRFFANDGSLTINRIMSVPGFSKTFPDQNDVQLLAAQKWGVKPVVNREDAEKRKAELVYVGANPYFHIDKLNNSIAYLVPRASILLQDIGRNFFDSLQCKGIPLHKIIITSVLRTTDDVARLRQRNSNATQNSCHLYGTTFDICYNRYMTVEAPGENRRAVRNDTLKWVFSEVLRDMREQNRCYIKYEVKQGCFHITVR